MSFAMRTAHEDDDTILDFEVEFDLSRFLSSVLDKTDQTSHSKVDYGILERHIVVVEQTVCLLRTLQDSSSNIGADDKEHLENLSSAFYDVSSALRQCFALASSSPTTIANDICLKVKSDGVSKPAFDISAELLEDFLSLGCSYTIISEMLRLSRWTVSNRKKDYGLEDFKSFSNLSDDEFDKVVRGFIREQGATNHFPRYHSVLRGKISKTFHLGHQNPLQADRDLPTSPRVTHQAFKIGFTLKANFSCFFLRESHMLEKAKI